METWKETKRKRTKANNKTPLKEDFKRATYPNASVVVMVVVAVKNASTTANARGLVVRVVPKRGISIFARRARVLKQLEPAARRTRGMLHSDGEGLRSDGVAVSTLHRKLLLIVSAS